MDEVYTEHDREYVDRFSPQYISPSPPLIRIPHRCPEDVVQRLAEAFVASWGDYDAAGNRIRCAVEALLDTLGVKEANLHQRIVSMTEKHVSVQKELLAIKWLGNAASHGNSLTRDDVFDALDIFEHVLDALYDDRKEILQRLVEGINYNKGPSRP
ncbi:DUF4145 domain-containing protein [Massilia eurypsychrophila]|uniref:DUF4145 domain-containing protein n=1 Tax=Massilia eurypsychrophila TaxID=1485217 RepID=UPI0015D4CA4F|nr:DUF4145 domain-containing protein [Massilia eurypsychrophila]